VRQRALGSFADGRVRVLVATDIVARGIDVDDISHVINFDLPLEPESYVHRIGRTARAGAGGVAWSFSSADEAPLLRAIEAVMQRTLPRSEDRRFASGEAERRGGDGRPRSRNGRGSGAPAPRPRTRPARTPPAEAAESGWRKPSRPSRPSQHSKPPSKPHSRPPAKSPAKPSPRPKRPSAGAAPAAVRPTTDERRAPGAPKGAPRKRRRRRRRPE